MSAKSYRLEWADHAQEPTDGVVQGPVWDDVRAIVEHLARSQEATGFIVLSRADNDFIQCARQPDGLIVEFHDPKADRHMALEGGAADGEFAVALFRAWFDDPATIEEHADWVEIEL